MHFSIAKADRDAGAKYRLNGRGEDYYGVLRRTAGVPGVLSEAAFMAVRRAPCSLAAISSSVRSGKIT